ncbi:hypothetical protein AM499_02700 [Bacillus sp. FJAT-22090]|uniref:ATP-binding protein n=1 Tax=Bacillus sp. FJAT-22090 TaxID=1581038 RepID=UPI0006AE468A|nr:AAA family ATPase [Bacillus sp. FJAT-22090]ALC84843.1 hypothetical protein AM499_02700 [Bacillus sp. FJAT-22090]
MSYKIGKILIENFKHVEKAELDFSKKDLIVFDGPNGFGKTTMFDAIELVVSGRISRITNTTDNRHGYKDLLFTNQDNKDTVIRIEFYNKEKQKFTVVKRFDHTTSRRAAERRPDNWDLFELYLLDNFDSPLLPEYRIDSEKIYSKLGLNNLSRYFSLFYYIQQEENTYFLRKSGKDRMAEISHLFDTYNEQQELEKISKLKNELDREQRKISGDNGDLSVKQQLLDTLTKGIKDVQKEELVEVNYFRLLQGDSPLKEWDKKEITVQKDTKDLYIKDLRQLYDFVQHFDEFLKSQVNRVIQNYIENKILLRDTIVSSNFLSKYDEIKELKNKEKKLRNIKKILTKDNLQNHIKSFPFKDLEQVVESNVDVNAIKGKLELLESYKQNSTNLSSIIQELNITRDKLMEHFNKTHQFGIGDQECPLCGHDWVNYEKLLLSVQSKREAFQRYYDDSSNKFEQELNSLFIEHLDSINLWIDEYVNESKNIINDDFYEQLTKSINRKQSTIKFTEWCSENNIDITIFANSKLNFVDDLEEKLEGLEKYLLKQKQPVKPGYTEFDEKSLAFDSLYQELFQGDEEQIRKITLENIINKANYINYQYYHRNSESITKLTSEIDELKTRLETVKLGITKIRRIIEIYNQRIRQHWQKILLDVEVPFYIYSGKILQDYQRGLGLFIKESEGDGAKSIKFVSNSSSDHDAVNYLSSGQLSGLVIAFTLALNKVYGNKTMDILLIDDPVQTMDEINMVSFVELLRNEFRNKQIFLSTHEDDTSRYMRYKFRKYNLETLRLNVKDRLYLVSQNKTNLDE